MTTALWELEGGESLPVPMPLIKYKGDWTVRSCGAESRRLGARKE